MGKKLLAYFRMTFVSYASLAGSEFHLVAPQAINEEHECVSVLFLSYFFYINSFFFFLLLNIFFLLSGFSRIFSQCESRWKITQNQLLGFSFQECCKNFDLFRLYLDSSFTYLFRPLLISLACPSLSPVSLE